MKGPFRRTESESGFTLVEITLAMTLFALLATITYAAFHLGHRALVRTESQAERNATLRAVEDLLGTYIRSAYPYRHSPQDPRVLFSGDADRLEFVSAVSFSLGGRGMSQVRLFWDREKEGGLALEEAMPLPLEENSEGHRSRITLWKNLESMRLDYLEPSQGDGGWTEGWDGEARRNLPRAVRLSFRTSEGNEFQWVFPIMMNVLAQ